LSFLAATDDRAANPSRPSRIPRIGPDSCHAALRSFVGLGFHEEAQLRADGAGARSNPRRSTPTEQASPSSTSGFAEATCAIIASYQGNFTSRNTLSQVLPLATAGMSGSEWLAIGP